MNSACSSPRGYLSLILHAHLPYVRNPDHERFLEESWFYEAMTETYLPLLWTLERLVQDGVDFRLTMSLTPTLVSMFDDELLRDRYEQKLDALLELSEKEWVRHSRHPSFQETAAFYRERFRSLRDLYLDTCRRDVTAAFRRLQDDGFVELLASSATHGFLPLLRHEPAAVHAQLKLGVDHYRRSFGRQPLGVWLPECAYYPGLDELLAEHGIRYFILESHGVLHGSTRPRYGVHAPIVCPSGVAAFARDPECSRQVWSSREGFPGHPDYREFYRDIGFELPLDYLERYIGPDGIRVQTGIKYHRVTGPTDGKEPYDRRAALERADEHASQFIDWRQKQVEWLASRMDRKPIIVAPYDAELFGHWWFEGPEWIDVLLRKLAADPATVMTATPSEYLAEYPEAQVSVPSASSWGYRGHNEVWVNGSNDWILPRVHSATRRMAHLAFRNRGAQGLRRRALNQAARELLLAQSSDWPFIIKSDTTTAYAEERVRSHLDGFESLARQVEFSGSADFTLEEPLLEALERRNNIFPDIRFDVFEDRSPRPDFAIPDSLGHVAFLTAEAVPLVKVGGLADVAGALPRALSDLGVRVTLILPAYRGIDRVAHRLRTVRKGLSVLLGERRVHFSLLEAAPEVTPGVRTLLVEQEDYFDRDGVYVDAATGEEHADTAERFVFFTKAALESLRRLGDPVDIIHCHDHQTALAPAYLKISLRGDPVLGLAASVYTLHNLGYQGVHEPDVLDIAGFGMDQFHVGSPFEHYGKVNFMKVGIHYADKVNTVSEGYAREIVEEESIGAGLRDVLRDRGRDFCGILNGIDVEEWNPASDRFLPGPYTLEDPSGKEEARRKLLEVSGLDAVPGERPVVGMITRLVDQKGLDLVHESLEELLSLGISLVVLGTGLPKYEQFLRKASTRFPGRVAAFLKFDNSLAHLIEAGADIFLMPSLYEPCGLNQMYSLRYGTVPVVRSTGGLADTVNDDDEVSGHGVGFSFREYCPEALVDTLRRAVQAYRDADRWSRIVRDGMARDHSWTASAWRYLEFYRSALAARSPLRQLAANHRRS